MATRDRAEREGKQDVNCETVHPWLRGFTPRFVGLQLQNYLKNSIKITYINNILPIIGLWRADLLKDIERNKGAVKDRIGASGQSRNPTDSLVCRRPGLRLVSFIEWRPGYIEDSVCRPHQCHVPNHSIKTLPSRHASTFPLAMSRHASTLPSLLYLCLSVLPLFTRVLCHCASSASPAFFLHILNYLVAEKRLSRFVLFYCHLTHDSP